MVEIGRNLSRSDSGKKHRVHAKDSSTNSHLNYPNNYSPSLSSSAPKKTVTSKLQTRRHTPEFITGNLGNEIKGNTEVTTSNLDQKSTCRAWFSYLSFEQDQFELMEPQARWVPRRSTTPETRFQLLARKVVIVKGGVRWFRDCLQKGY